MPLLVDASSFGGAKEDSDNYMDGVVEATTRSIMAKQPDLDMTRERQHSVGNW